MKTEPDYSLCRCANRMGVETVLGTEFGTGKPKVFPVLPQPGGAQVCPRTCPIAYPPPNPSTPPE